MPGITYRSGKARDVFISPSSNHFDGTGNACADSALAQLIAKGYNHSAFIQLSVAKTIMLAGTIPAAPS